MKRYLNALVLCILITSCGGSGGGSSGGDSNPTVDVNGLWVGTHLDYSAIGPEKVKALVVTINQQDDVVDGHLDSSLDIATSSFDFDGQLNGDDLTVTLSKDGLCAASYTLEGTCSPDAISGYIDGSDCMSTYADAPFELEAIKSIAPSDTYFSVGTWKALSDYYFMFFEIDHDGNGYIGRMICFENGWRHHDDWNYISRMSGDICQVVNENSEEITFKLCNLDGALTYPASSFTDFTVTIAMYKPATFRYTLSDGGAGLETTHIAVRLTY